MIAAVISVCGAIAAFLFGSFIGYQNGREDGYMEGYSEGKKVR